MDPDAIDDEAPIEPDFNGCLGRIPLVHECGMWHRDYDQELLKLIKSKFTPMVEDADGDDAPIETPNHMKVIRPFLKSEYDQYMKSLPPGDKAFVMSVIHNIDAWDYDVWSVQDFANRGALFYTAYALFMRWDFLRKFNMDEEIAINFISQIEAGYHPNPYHNSMHGGDVMQILHYILSPGGLKETAQLTDEDLLAAIIAGMIHDYDHPGILHRRA